MIELMRPHTQRPSEVEGVTTPAGVRVLFIAQPQCPVRITQHPGANRAIDTGQSFGILVEEVSKMAMLLVVVEVQHLVGVLQDLGELTRPTVASAGVACPPISRSALPVARAMSSISCTHIRDSATRPCDTMLSDQSPEDGRQRVVALERLRQGKCRMQAGPDFRSCPAFERPPRGAKAAAQLQFAGVSLRRPRQGGDQFKPLVEMSDRLGQGHALQRQLAGGLPERNGNFGKARCGEVMRQHLGFGGLDVREALPRSRGRSWRATPVGGS